MKKMKKAEEDYKSLLVRYKEAKCEIKMLNGKLTKSYTKVKFLELKVVQANAKVEWVSTKKLDDVLSSQKNFSNKNGLGGIGESSSAVNISKEVNFVKAKDPGCWKDLDIVCFERGDIQLTHRDRDGGLGMVKLGKWVGYHYWQVTKEQFERLV